MLGRLRTQHDFWDAQLYERAIPEDHLLRRIDECIDFSFVEEETSDLYCSDNGRPSYAPEQLFRVIFVSYLYNLSDVRVVQELRYNLLYRYFCRFSLSDDTPDDRTLVVFRARLGEERFRRLFDRIVKQAMELGLLTERRKIIDATVIRADVALKNRAELLRQGRGRVTREVGARCPERAAALERFSGSKDEEGKEGRAQVRRSQVVASHAEIPVPGQVARCHRDAHDLHGTQREENRPAHPTKRAAGRVETGSSGLLRGREQ